MTTKTTKALLIDPVAQRVTEIDIVSDKRTGRFDLNTLLSFPGHECQNAECYPVGGGDHMFVDDSAALDSRLPNVTLKTHNRGNLKLFGRVLILNHTPNGNPANVKLTVAALEALVEWPNAAHSMMWKLTDGVNVGGAA